MSYLDKLKSGNSLELYRDNSDEPIFTSSSHWLHPLFEVEEFLNQNPFERSALSLHDTVSGFAAAALTLRLGIKRVNADLMSKGALKLYEKYGATYHYEHLIDKIQCATESLLNDSMTLEECYLILKKRAGR